MIALSPLSGMVRSRACRRRVKGFRLVGGEGEEELGCYDHGAGHGVSILLLDSLRHDEAPDDVQEEEQPEDLADVPDERLHEGGVRTAFVDYLDLEESLAYRSPAHRLEESEVEDQEETTHERETTEEESIVADTAEEQR